MQFLSSITSIPVLLSPLLFHHAARAELLGCDAVGCPVDEYRNAQCKVGNATLKAVGIANVTTTIETQPLTWTLGLQETRDAGNGSQSILTLDRNFYLGTPPALELKGVTGCAFFFENIAANVTAPVGDQVDNFTCSDVLGQDCVADLITETQVAGEAVSDSEFCNKLRDSLVTKKPSTCKGVNGFLSTIVVRPITGDNALRKEDQSTCRPTTGQGYDISLINSQRQQPASRELKELAPIINAITPVMTVFRKGNDTTTNLTCLKLVDSKATETTNDLPSQGSFAGINVYFTVYFTLISSILVVLF